MSSPLPDDAIANTPRPFSTALYAALTGDASGDIQTRTFGSDANTLSMNDLDVPAFMPSLSADDSITVTSTSYSSRSRYFLICIQ